MKRLTHGESIRLLLVAVFLLVIFVLNAAFVEPGDSLLQTALDRLARLYERSGR